MAFLLRKTAANPTAQVNLASVIPFLASGGAGYTGNWQVRFRFQLTSSNCVISQRIGGGALEAQNLIFFTSPTVLQLRRSNVNSNLTLPVSAAAGASIYRITGNAALNNVTVFQDEVLVGTLSGANLFADLGRFFGLGNTTRLGDFYWFEVSNNGELVHFYNPSTVLPDQNILVDEIGGNNGTLVNFPTDGSARVFYDDGGSTPISFNGTIPNISANVGDVVNVDLSAFFDGTELPFVFTSIGADLSAVGLSIASNAIVGTATLGSLIGARIRGTDAALNTADSNLFDVTVAAVAVNVDSTVSATWPQLTVNANQVSAVPVYTSSVSAQWPMLSVQASQSAVAPQYASSIAATWPMFSAAASQQSAVPQYTLSASATWPMFTVQSTQQQQLPDGATTVSVTWPLFAVNGSQASTVPEYNAAAAAQWPIFAVTAAQEQDLPVGGATVAVTWPMLSVSVTQQSVAPQYSLTVAGTWPMFNVSGLAGEFDYFTAPSARYVIPKLSRRATIPAQSRAVTVPSLSRRIAL